MFLHDWRKNPDVLGNMHILFLTAPTPRHLSHYVVQAGSEPAVFFLASQVLGLLTCIMALSSFLFGEECKQHVCTHARSA